MRKTKRNLWLISLIVTLSLLVACGPEPLVLDDVIVGTWATSLADSDTYEDVMFDTHTVEFKSNGEYFDKVNFIENNSYKDVGTYTVKDSILQYDREERTGSALCPEVDSIEKFEVLSIKQNQITLEMLTSGCLDNPTKGATVVFDRCEWPPDAETAVFAYCTPIESE